jgi:hypothetical protein
MASKRSLDSIDPADIERIKRGKLAIIPAQDGLQKSFAFEDTTSSLAYAQLE